MEPTPDDVLLTAYLDDELAPQDRRHLEQRLANEAELQRELDLLKETRDYLDLLEQESVNAEQIETTLQIAAVSISKFPLAASRASRFGRWAITAIVALTLFAVTFQIGNQSPLSNPSFRQTVERLDMYLAILDDDGIELLQHLAMNRVFLPQLSDDVSPVAQSEYKPQPRGWLANTFTLSTAGEHRELDESGLYQLLHRNIQTYRRLPPEKAKQIQKLHLDIETAPRRTELLLTLQNYYHWFKSLQPYEKIELRKPRTIAEKVTAIIDLKTYLEQEPGDVSSVISEIVGIEESKQLVETLEGLILWRKERLLNEEPIRIINELKQSSLR